MSKMNSTQKQKKSINFELEKEIEAAQMFLSRTNEDFLKKMKINNKNNNIENIEDNNENNINIDKKEEINNNIINTNNIVQEINIDKDLLYYKKYLKNYNFPEIGNIIFPTDKDKEQTIKFLHFIITKKSNENEEKTRTKKQVNLF
jgi:hypothetical protein